MLESQFPILLLYGYHKGLVTAPKCWKVAKLELTMSQELGGQMRWDKLHLLMNYKIKCIFDKILVGNVFNNFISSCATCIGTPCTLFSTKLAIPFKLICEQK